MAAEQFITAPAAPPKSSSGSAYQLILDHILTYPGSYEIPLRTMYTLNCAPRAQPLPRQYGTPTSSNGSSPIYAQGSPTDPQGNDQSFTENLLAQLAQVPNQPTSLPPSFITAFAHRCFPSDLVQVDFPQALTALDYLKDLESRRRREVAAAMRRIDLGDRHALDQNVSKVSESRPGVSRWVQSIEEKEHKIDSLYTQLYIGLRRWILINELSLLPFNKHNCWAMLNTLYPPKLNVQPTSKLTLDVLQTQRQGYFKYIQSVEKNGPRILDNLLHQGEAQGDANGWPAVTRTLSLYLQVANSVIAECMAITSADDLGPPAKDSDSLSARHNRKADSGVSFGGSDGSDRRPSTGGGGSGSHPVEPMPPRPAKTLPLDTTLRSRSPGTSRPATPRPGTALEKLARGLKSIGRSKTVATEMLSDEARTPVQRTEKPRALRKMKSLGSLDAQTIQSHLDNPPPSSVEHLPPPESEGMRRQRLRHEAQALAQETFGTRQSTDV